MSAEPQWNFALEPADEPMSETGYNLRAYLDLMPDAKMRQYQASWTDEELMAWDDNFTSEDELLLPCSETDVVDAAMYRRFLEKAIAYRDRVRGDLKD